MPGIDLLDRPGGKIERPGHLVELELAALHAEQAELQDLNDPAERRIAGQYLHQALRLGQRGHLRPKIADLFEQQPVLRKKAAAFGLFDGKEQILLLRQALHQPVHGLVGEFGRRRIDHGDDGFELRKRLLEGGFALPPRDMRRDQLVDVGRHGEMRRRVPGRQQGQAGATPR